MILGDKFHKWDNFPWFVPKQDSPIFIVSKNDSPKFYRIKLFYLKNAKNL